MRIITFASALLLAASTAGAQSDSTRLRVDLPVLDLPYNIAHGVRAPSMAQSLAITTGFYETSHALIQRAWGTRTLPARLSIVAFDYFTIALPLADAWLHEEYHRAVLGNRGIDSFNDVYNFDIFAEAIAVSHVRDEDLVRLKRDHPNEHVRLHVAGIEGEQMLVQQLEINRFFRDARAWNAAMYWLIKLSSGGYVQSAVWDETNADTDEMTAEDGPDVKVRDFTGHDFTAWAYDLHRPGEPYEARGPHPSGVGIDRYIRPNDLTAEEFDYLERQGWLQLINLLDPNLIGRYRFTVNSPLNGRPLQFNITASHTLTSFGHSIAGNLFVRQDAMNLLLIIHGYANGERSFPGIDARIIGYPVAVRGRQLDISPRFAVWLQPKRGRFDATGAAPGVFASVKVHSPATDRFGWFAELDAKTAGWVAGNVHLTPNVGLRAGATIKLPNAR